jgi:hypothetical protein
MLLQTQDHQGEQIRGPYVRQGQREEPDDVESFPIPDDTSHWDVFIPDDDEIDPLPEPGDFWIEPEDSQGAWSKEQGAGSNRIKP